MNTSTDEQIDAAVSSALLHADPDMPIREIVMAVVVALTKDAEPQPAKKPLPKLPMKSQENWIRDADRSYIGPAGYEYAAFAGNLLPEFVALLREEEKCFPYTPTTDPTSLIGVRNALLAKVAGYEFGEAER